MSIALQPTTAVETLQQDPRPSRRDDPKFNFVDLFAGVGGFHAVLAKLGGRLTMAVEIDEAAAETYRLNWGVRPESDVVDVARNRIAEVGQHAVLSGGFPCQPFSKSGRQRGMAEERGQMFDEILRVLSHYTPPVVFLENVRNLTGPRQRETWDYVIRGLRDVGYRVSSAPVIVSPHRLPPEHGGAPQSRERVYILGTYVGPQHARRETSVASFDPYLGLDSWSPQRWNLLDYLDKSATVELGFGFTEEERLWLDTWQDFLSRTAHLGLPGFPLWSTYWASDAKVDPMAPVWKQRFEAKNIAFYHENRPALDGWLKANPQLRGFPLSRQKFEWQAKDAPRDIFQCLIHLRPSGIRVKRLDYAPALVAMAQTPLIGPLRRRMTPKETARLQNFPDWFKLDHQSRTKSYKQLGNAINVGVALHVFSSYVLREAEAIGRTPAGHDLVEAVLSHSGGSSGTSGSCAC